MINKDNFKDLINYILVIGLFILAGFVLFPIIYAIIYGILVAYIFYPVHKFLLKGIKNEFLSAMLVCIGVFIILAGAIILLFSAVFRQSIDFYLLLQKTDFGSLISSIIPEFITSSGISDNFISSLNTYISNWIATFLREFTGLISNLPTVILQFAVFIFTFFFALKDGDKAIEYIKSLSPVKKETEEKFFKKFKEITNSVLIGQIFVGIVQGVIAGIGYYIFGVKSAILLTFLTGLAAIIPVLGAWLIWVPVDIYLFAKGDTTAGLGLLIYGVFLISLVDNILRSLIVSRKTKINTGIIIIGMLGGLLVFGFLGLIIGPLILSYVLLVIELYRKNTFGDTLFNKPE